MAKATPTATSQAFSVSSTEEDDEVIKKGRATQTVTTAPFTANGQLVDSC